jgi:hypothetical protein
MRPKYPNILWCTFAPLTELYRSIDVAELPCWYAAKALPCTAGGRSAPPRVAR